MEKYLVLFVFIILGCTDQAPSNKGKDVDQLSFLDSLKSICLLNTLETFDIQNLQTDDFKNMSPISEKLFKTIYPNRDDFTENSFFIFSRLSGNDDHLYLITYQKNQESEDYRVDYINLVNIDSRGKLIEETRLAAEDNEVITYEVRSLLNGIQLTVVEKISTEINHDLNHDTLFTNQYLFQLNGPEKMDTLHFSQSFEIHNF